MTGVITINPTTGYSDDIDYGLLEGAEKIAKAIEDCISYLGIVNFVRFTNAMRQEYEACPIQFRMWCKIAGIHGYPIQALTSFIWGFEDTVKQETLEIA